MRPNARRTPPHHGFTLVELLIVILIIGIIMAFVLAVSFSGLEAARHRATQSLITKLSVALEDRLDALLQKPPTVNGSHRFLAAINTTSYPAGSAFLPWGLQSEQRAQAIARLDQIRMEFPDVFFIDPSYGSSGGSPSHPLNFCGFRYNPTNASVSVPQQPYILPLGQAMPPGFTPTSDPPAAASGYSAAQQDPDGDGVANIGPGNLYTGTAGNVLPINVQGEGIYGASYNAAASLYRLAGYNVRGCNGVDDNANGIVDEFAEGTTLPGPTSDSGAVEKFTTFLANHAHKTARSEMLYAILVNGQGPLGSSFGPDDFTANEVKDTDNDGVPEFVDAWGQPLLFYRWPVGHISESQVGFDLYNGLSDPRQTNPLDPDRQLTALGWWADPSGSMGMSSKAAYVSNYLYPLSESAATLSLAGNSVGNLWERTATGTTGYHERAFYTRFLIASGGPDLAPGLFVNPQGTFNGMSADAVTTLILGGEALATKYIDPDSAAVQQDPSLDDLTNQNIQNRGGGIQ